MSRPRAPNRRLGQGDLLGGRYRIAELLGAGGMADVYRAQRVDLDRAVAVKVLRGSEDLDAQRRFLREAKLTARLQHPNLVTLLDLGELPPEPEQPTSYFLVFEYLVGETVASWVDREGRVPVATAIAWGIQMARGLRAAHEVGVLHRDLKSDNVFIVASQDEVLLKLIDFGLAQHFERGSADTLREKGITVGAVEYMAPEHFDNRPIDTRTDLYALGVVLFELLTGTLPFQGQNETSVMLQHVGALPPSFASVCPTLEAPPELEALVRQLLEKPQDRRPASAGEVVTRLAALLREGDDDDARWSFTEVPTLVSAGRFMGSRPLVSSPDRLAWHAEHAVLGFRVLVEWLPEGASAEAVARRLLACAAPGIPRPLDTGASVAPGEGKPRPYVVFDHPQGLTLTSLVAEDGPLDPLQVISLGRRLSHLLATLHAGGIAHGRISADNIWVEPLDVGEACLDGVDLSPLGAAQPRGAHAAASRQDVADLARVLWESQHGPENKSAFREATLRLTRRSSSKNLELGPSKRLNRVLARAIAGGPDGLEEASKLRDALEHLLATDEEPLHVDLVPGEAPRLTPLPARPGGSPSAWLLAEHGELPRSLCDALERLVELRRVSATDRGPVALSVARRELVAPWLVVFGGGLGSSDPVLEALARGGDAARLLVLGEPSDTARVLDPAFPGCEAVVGAWMPAHEVDDHVGRVLAGVRRRREGREG